MTRGSALLGAAGAAIVVAVAFPAAAQTLWIGNEPHVTGNHFASPQNFMLEFRFGTYEANIDSEFNGTASPYQDIFGAAPNYNSGSPRVMAGLEVDWQILRIAPILSLGVGISASFTGVTDSAPFSRQMNDAPSGWVRSTESTALYVVPMTFVAVARFDGLARAVQWFPFVPYVKVGLAYGIWWTMKGSNSDADGGSAGWDAAVGLQFLLDRLEPQAAREMDATQGVNHTYLFAEAFMMNLSGFGRPQLDVGTTSWCAGLSAEF